MASEFEIKKKDEQQGIDFEVPSWAGKPPPGFHLDVMKGEKLIQKLMIDEKKCYFFGRNPQLCDFAIDHSSCSRVHAALLYHRQLSRCFLVDLGSTHGTFIGKVRLEGHQPQHLTVDQVFHFGASTRNYILREKPSAPSFGREDERDSRTGADSSQAGHLLGLPEREEELENLTEYNTALNRRIGNMAIPEDDFGKFRKRKNISVSFDDEEQIINPEDIDPSIGRFRNLVHTALIPKKKQRLEVTGFSDASEEHYSGSENAGKSGSHVSAVHSFQTGSHLSGFGPISAKLGLSLPNSAPDIELYGPTVAPVSLTGSARVDQQAPVEDEPRKKKYAKEAWPGKKTGAHLLV